MQYVSLLGGLLIYEDDLLPFLVPTPRSRTAARQGCYAPDTLRAQVENVFRILLVPNVLLCVEVPWPVWQSLAMSSGERAGHVVADIAARAWRHAGRCAAPFAHVVLGAEEERT